MTKLTPAACRPVSINIRTRNTSRTRDRVDNLVRLIAELRKRDMQSDEISAFLRFSPAGTRKYIRDLREAGLLETFNLTDEAFKIGCGLTYRITGDVERVDLFLAAIAQPRPVERIEDRAKAIQTVNGMARSFHILADDVQPPIKASRVTVARDELVEALFGPARVIDA